MTTKEITLTVNGEEHSLEVETRTLLVHALREHLDLTGTHIGCDTGNCGACTVVKDGEAVKSCLAFAVQADGSEIMTVEGMEELPESHGELHPLQEGFEQEHGLQCGYCTPGMIMAGKALLDENPNPTEAEIRDGISGNLCRCTGYQNIVKSIEYAADKLEEEPAAATDGGQRAAEAGPDTDVDTGGFDCGIDGCCGGTGVDHGGEANE